MLDTLACVVLIHHMMGRQTELLRQTMCPTPARPQTLKPLKPPRTEADSHGMPGGLVKAFCKELEGMGWSGSDRRSRKP